MRVITLCFMCFLSFTINGGEMADSMVGQLAVELTVSKAEIMPYEPVVFHAKIWNSSNEPKEFIISMSFIMSIITRYTKDGKWVGYTPLGLNPSPLPPEKVTVAPKGDLCDWNSSIDISLDAKHVFAETGDYWIKLLTVFGESAPVKISVKSPSSDENVVLKYIKKERLYLWCSRHSVFAVSQVQPDKLDDARNHFTEMLSRYPSSYYAKWAKQAISWIDAAKKDELDPSDN